MPSAIVLGRAASTTTSWSTCCPPAEAMVVPSTFPEAFGMVAAEAAACGALPVVRRHSGLAEVARTLAAARPARPAAVAAFERRRRTRSPSSPAAWPAGSRPPEELRAATREALVATARERYSWDGVARDVIAAARGAGRPAAPRRSAPPANG